MSDTGVPSADGANGETEKLPETYKFFDLPLAKWELFDSINLKRSRIVLARDINPVIDFFNSADVGIGARAARDAAAALNLTDPERRRLAALLRVRSYDVYTLRAALGIHLNPQHFQ